MIDNNVVIIVTDIVFQGAKGFIVSNEELNGVLEVPGLGFDADRLNIISKIEGNNIYSFSAGL